MSFSTLKSQHGTRLIQAVAIYPNACKYSVDDTINKGVCTNSGATVNDAYTGVMPISESAGSDVLFFTSANPYAITSNNEIIKVTIDSDTQITIVSRGQFGTAASDIYASSELRIIHGGEADGSCRGYPQRPDGKGCSNSDSFDRDVTREFLFTDVQLVSGEVYYNGLGSISHSPTKLKPSLEMAKNATVSVTIKDNEDGDQYAVPYSDRRTTKSTLLRKLQARTGGYLRNRRMIVYSGFTVNNVFDPANCISREYIIDDFNISNSDSVSIKGVDPLMLAEEAKAKTHDVSAGSLLIDITETSTQITLKNALLDEYGANTESGTVIIDSELINYTVNDSAAGILDIVSRGVAGSEQKDHKINASAQKCLVLNNFNPVQEIVNILQSRTLIESRFYDDYTDVIATVPNNAGTVYVTKPDSVKKFINTIIRSWAENNISLYFDELKKKIRIKAVGDFEQQPITLTDVDLLIDSVRIDNKYEDQITRASIGFAPFDASKKTDDENSSIIFQSINIGTESIGTLEPQEEKTFYTKFLTDSDIDVSIAVGGISRLANINTKPPQEYRFTIDYEKYGDVTGGNIEEGEIINVTTELSIDDDGQPLSQNLQILSIKDDMKDKRATVTAITYQDIINVDDFDFIIDEDKENYDLSTEYAPTEAGEYVIFIASNVTIGATSVDNLAFTTGNQASGVTFKIVHRGQILAAGGAGGDAPDATSEPEIPVVQVGGTRGGDGGDAINITVPTVLDVTQGVVYAGGGGSPSIRSVSVYLNQAQTKAGNGGCGGQGYVGGKFGLGGACYYLNISETIDVGVNGVSGSRAAPGVLGDISAGAWGSDSDSSSISGAAGKSGYAIRSNGNAVIITGDNNATIRGQRDF
tara:strand:- start:384 stop:2993 length:2610 start_codon:yes stop_codon:yes gene_type:complete